MTINDCLNYTKFTMGVLHVIFHLITDNPDSPLNVQPTFRYLSNLHCRNIYNSGIKIVKNDGTPVCR